MFLIDKSQINYKIDPKFNSSLIDLPSYETLLFV